MAVELEPNNAASKRGSLLKAADRVVNNIGTYSELGFNAGAIYTIIDTRNNMHRFKVARRLFDGKDNSALRDYGDLYGAEIIKEHQVKKWQAVLKESHDSLEEKNIFQGGLRFDWPTRSFLDVYRGWRLSRAKESLSKIKNLREKRGREIGNVMECGDVLALNAAYFQLVHNALLEGDGATLFRSSPRAKMVLTHGGVTSWAENRRDIFVTDRSESSEDVSVN